MTYSLWVHDGPFGADVVRAGYELNAPVVVAPGGCESGSFVTVDHPAAIVETVKRGEDGRGTVVRLYESLGGSARVRLRLAGKVKSAEDCDMLERPRRKLRIGRDGAVLLRLRPFEVRTIRFR